MFPYVRCLTLALSVHYAVGGQCSYWNNPELQEFQDESSCFPFNGTWYILYKNFNDPTVGEAKCVHIAEYGKYENGVAHVKYNFGDQSLDATLSLKSGDGYDVDNILTLQLTGGDSSADHAVVFTKCQKCLILHHGYHSDKSFTLWVQEDYLREDHSCCDFVYYLVAGTDGVTTIYDETCN